MNAPATEIAVSIQPTFGDIANQLAASAETAPEIAKEFQIDGPEMYEAAGKQLSELGQRRKQIEKLQDGMLEPFKEAKRKIEEGRKKITDFFARPIAALKEAEGILTRSCAGYMEDQRRLREKAEAEARREQERLMQEAEKKAAKAEAKGNTEKAEEIRAAILIVAPALVAPEPAKIHGVSFRDVWHARVVDAKAVPREYLVVDEAMLDKLAKATKGSVPVAGVEFYCEKVSIRR